MANQLFYKISEEKRKRIESALLKEFSNYSFEKAQVKRIVEESNIPRGSFYQYFDDLEDAFIYVLSLIRNDIIENQLIESSNKNDMDKLTLIKENFKTRIVSVFSSLNKTNEYKVVSQIRNSEKAIDIFLDQIGVLPNMSNEKLYNLLVGENTKKDVKIELLPEILFPTLKITLRKLFKEEIDVKTALEEIDNKIEVIQYGCQNRLTVF